MIFIYDFHLSDFTFELIILSNHTKHPKKTSAVLYITPFYTYLNIVKQRYYFKTYINRAKLSS